MPENKEELDENEFDWIKVKEKYETKPITQKDKLITKFKQNPFVPIGAILTSVCLGYGLYSYRKGQARMSQLMMRSRVAAQGFTVFALVLGIGMGLHNSEN